MDKGDSGSGPLGDGASRRRYLAGLVGLVAGASLAGCSSDDVNPPEQVTETTEGDAETPRRTATGTDENAGTSRGTADAALGDVIEGDQLALAAYSVERTTSVSQFTQADSGNEFVVVDMAAKNKSETEYVQFSSFLQLSLRDDESYEYDETITGAENTLDSGELAPGEVTRGVLVFEVPQGASGLSLSIDLDESIFNYDGATIDLESQGSGRTLTQDLAVPVYDVGDTLSYQESRFSLNSVRTSTGSGYFAPDSGNEYVVIDITVSNTGDEELSVSTFLQMTLKDDAGRTYDTSIVGSGTLDREFSQGRPISPGSQRRGEVAFEVPAGVSPLYLAMDFELFAEGDKSFFRLR